MQTSIQTPMETTRQHANCTMFTAASQAARWMLLGCMLSGAGMHAHALVLPFTHREGGSQHKEIEGLEQDWRQALISSNVTALDRLLADDYLGVTANGTLETKADLLALRRGGTVRISELNLSDLKIRVYGDTAVVTSRAELTGTNGGTDISGHYRYTRVYNRREGQWRIVSFEASRIADSGRDKK